MNLLDLSVLVMVGLRLMVAARRGFYREFVFLLSIAVGLVVGWFLFPLLSDLLSGLARGRLTFLRFLGDRTVSDTLSFALGPYLR